MKRIAAFLLLAALSVAGAVPAQARRINTQDTSRQSKAAKRQQKMLRKANKRQQKAMKRYEKKQRKAIKRANRRRTI